LFQHAVVIKQQYEGTHTSKRENTNLIDTKLHGKRLCKNVCVILFWALGGWTSRFTGNYTSNFINY